jgi:hypothetical protein
VNSLQELIDLNAFIPDSLVQRQITFKLEEGGEEKTFDIYVRRLNIAAHERIWGGGLTDEVSKTARLLSEAIRLGPNGEEKLPYEKAVELHPNIALAMSQAINEVNGTKAERKN